MLEPCDKSELPTPLEEEQSMDGSGERGALVAHVHEEDERSLLHEISEQNSKRQGDVEEEDR